MKRQTAKTTNRTARPSAIKQQSTLLSFFSPKQRQAASSSYVPKQSVNSTSPVPDPFSQTSSLTTPSKTPSNPSITRPIRSRTYAERYNNSGKAEELSATLKRELFADADAEETPSKRTRIEQISDGIPSITEKPFPSRKTNTTHPSFSQKQTSSRRRPGGFFHTLNKVANSEPISDSVEETAIYPAASLDDQQSASPCASPDAKKESILEESGKKPFDFHSLTCSDRSKDEPYVFDLRTRAPCEQRQKVKAKLVAQANAASTAVKDEAGWCQRHPWSINIRDGKKRSKSHPDYDKSTLYVPSSDLSDQRGTKNGGLSPFQRQFWSIKKDNYDVLIFFKKGKFYELYDVDADIGHKELGLNYTKGGRVDMRCCGIPEQSFDKHTAKLVELGYKVGRVEQTETALAAEKRKNSTPGKKSTICERSLVRILTKATVTDDSFLRDHRSRYVIAIAEDIATFEQITSEGLAEGNKGDYSLRDRKIAVCYVDVASGSINLREYHDDARLCKTERLITFLQPQEYITDMSKCSERLSHLVLWASRRSEAELYDLAKKDGYQAMTESKLASYLLDSSSTAEQKEEYERTCRYVKQYELASKAFGAMAAHLKSLIIDRETLSIGNYNLFPNPDKSNTGTLCEDENKDMSSRPSSTTLRMDAPTLQNLEILTSSLDGSDRGSLLSFIDKAQTPAGRRLLRQWISQPLVCSEDIEDRLQAVEDIHEIEDEDGGRTLRRVLKHLKTKKDLERALPRIHRQATTGNKAVMFDDTNKRLVKDFVAVLQSLQDSLFGMEAFANALESTRPKSKRLQWLCSVQGGIPVDAIEKLNYFLGEAFDFEKAESAGEIVPKEGGIPIYDGCRNELNDVERELSRELQKWQTNLEDRTIKFYHRGKEPYQLEVKIDTIRGRTPDEFEVVSESKTSKRFYTKTLKRLISKQKVTSEAFDVASSNVATDIIRQFDQEYSTWAAISCVCAEADALIGLAYASRDEGSGPMTRPQILPNNHPTPVLQAKGLRHPVLAKLCESFVSNDLQLGGSEGNPDILILTGPNAGGKSTLARQVALASILAQIGCFVPAKSFCFRPFEDIYVRMGASDDLARGRSTFMVEMEEVSNILNNASNSSLVIADEVGRGTSTHDGYAVAYATLDHIARINKSLTVFSTHYSQLGDDIVALGRQGGRSSAASYEMAAVVNEKTKAITFLYKLQEGNGGQSRGIYCARVAGIPASIANEAEKAALGFDRLLAQRLSLSKFCKLNTSLDNGVDGALDAILNT